jgi:mannose-6-phosphate isomerase-like protein (cupin superfamily)
MKKEKVRMFKDKVSIENAVAQLSKEVDQHFTLLMKHSNMTVEYYAPQRFDLQTPHVQDEIYVIANGSGTFIKNKEKILFATGDLLFVPAKMEHRFENFSDDFATWVIFYGDTK